MRNRPATNAGKARKIKLQGARNEKETKAPYHTNREPVRRQEEGHLPNTKQNRRNDHDKHRGQARAY